MAPARVIALALILGQVLFAGVIVIMHQVGAFADGGGQLAATLSPLALVFGFVMVPPALLLHHKAQQRIAELPEAQRAAARLSAMIVSMAMLEGASLLNLVTWLMTRSPMPNVAVVGLLIAVQIYLIPRE